MLNVLKDEDAYEATQKYKSKYCLDWNTNIFDNITCLNEQRCKIKASLVLEVANNIIIP